MSLPHNPLIPVVVGSGIDLFVSAPTKFSNIALYKPMVCCASLVHPRKYRLVAIVRRPRIEDSSIRTARVEVERACAALSIACLDGNTASHKRGYHRYVGPGSVAELD